MIESNFHRAQHFPSLCRSVFNEHRNGEEGREEGSGADNTVDELLIFVRNGVQVMKERKMCDISKKKKRKEKTSWAAFSIESSSSLRRHPEATRTRQFHMLPKAKANGGNGRDGPTDDS